MSSHPQRGEIGALVLAAGASTRFGAAKQLALHQGIPLARRAACAAVDAGAYPVVVVLGAHGEQVAETLADLTRVRTLVHDGWREGLASSLAAGLGALAPWAGDGVLVTLADQPLVDAAALRSLLLRFSTARRVVAAGYGDTIGVPAVFGHEHLPALQALVGDAGAGGWLRRHRDQVTVVPMPGAALDVDTPADLARIPRSEASETPDATAVAGDFPR